MSDEYDSRGHKDRTDEELMGLYQNGNEAAFEELYSRYRSRIYGYIKLRLSEKDWVDDVFQLVFTKLHRTRHQFDLNFRFDQWVFVMTKTVLLDFWKTTGVKNKRYFSESLESAPVDQLSTIDPIPTNPTLLPEAVMASLSQDQRSVVEFKFIDEMSYDEIAKKLGRSQESVRQLVSRALRKLKQHVKKSDRLS